MIEFFIISPDGFPTTMEPFQANDKLHLQERVTIEVKNFISRFEKQGYYSTMKRNAISLKELPNHCQIKICNQ